MSTEPSTMGNEQFHKCMKSLIRICEEFSLCNEKAVTHSMNILRAIYRQSQLSDLVSSYVEFGIRIAINGFNNLSWGVSSLYQITVLVTTHDQIKMSNFVFQVQSTNKSEKVSWMI